MRRLLVTVVVVFVLILLLAQTLTNTRHTELVEYRVANGLEKKTPEKRPPQQPCFLLFGERVCSFDDETYNFCLDSRRFDPALVNPEKTARCVLRQDSSSLCDGKSADCNHRWLCFPRVVLLGYPKCATSTLHRMISNHPQFDRGLQKELHYYKYEWLRNQTQDIANDQITECYFDNFYAGKQYVMSDSTPTNLYFGLVKNVVTYTPNARAIVTLREPVTRMVSAHFYFLRSELETEPRKWNDNKNKPFSSILDSPILTGNMSEIALSMTPRNERFYSQVEADIVASSYAYRMEEVFQYMNREQVLVIRQEDLASQSAEVLKRVGKHIGLSEEYEWHPEIWRGHIPQFYTERDMELLKTINQETLDRLYEFFEPHNRKLAELLQDDRFLWKDTPRITMDDVNELVKRQKLIGGSSASE